MTWTPDVNGHIVLDYDCETTGVQPWAGHESFMWQFGTPDGECVVILENKENRAEIQSWFDRVGPDKEFTHIRAHNGKFDRAFAETMGYNAPGDGTWLDSMVVAHAINENRSVALKSVANEVLGEGSDDLQKEVKTWLTEERRRRAKQAKADKVELVEPNYSDVPYELMRDYAEEDIHLTRRVSEQYDPVIASTADLKSVVEFEMDVFDALYAVEKRGMPVDALGYRYLEKELMENLEIMEHDIDKLVEVDWDYDEFGEFDFNPKSSAQLYAALERRGADLSLVENNSMDKENLGTVDDVLAEMILNFRAEYKTLSTYTRPMIEKSYSTSLRSWKLPFIAPDGRVHAGYRQIGARTGRMSCSDPNMQNQPRDDLRLRYNVRAEPGHKLVAVDLSNIEMCVFAAYAGEGALLNAIRNGEDLHIKTAKSVGLGDQRRAGGHITTSRQRGKEFNFQMVYGGGAPTVMKTQRVGRDQAKLMIRRYHDAYPEVDRLKNRIHWRLEDTGYIRSLMGRRFRMRSKDSFKAVNYLVQGSSADILKKALVKLHKQGVPVVALVHDEIVAHVPAGEAEEVKRMIEAAMVDIPEITDKVPLKAEGEIIDRWSEAKDPTFKPRWAKEIS